MLILAASDNLTRRRNMAKSSQGRTHHYHRTVRGRQLANPRPPANDPSPSHHLLLRRSLLPVRARRPATLPQMARNRGRLFPRLSLPSTRTDVDVRQPRFNFTPCLQRCLDAGRSHSSAWVSIDRRYEVGAVPEGSTAAE